MAIVADLETVHKDVTRLMQRVYGDRLAKIILYGEIQRLIKIAENFLTYVKTTYA